VCAVCAKQCASPVTSQCMHSHSGAVVKQLGIWEWQSLTIFSTREGGRCALATVATTSVELLSSKAALLCLCR
jgi:hypothetical protein